MRPHLALAVLGVCATVAPAAHAQLTAGPAVPSQAVAELACSPRQPVSDLRNAVRVQGGLERRTRYLLAPGDRIVLDAGTDRGLLVGSSHLVRRMRRPVGGDESSSYLDTIGWVEIESVQAVTATARVVWACDGIISGDALEPFSLGTAVVPGAGGTPAYAAAGSVRAGSDGRITGASGDRMLVDAPSAGALAPGQRVTFFRRLYDHERHEGPLTTIGEGYVIESSGPSAIVRVDRSTMPIEQGDGVAPHR